MDTLFPFISLHFNLVLGYLQALIVVGEHWVPGCLSYESKWLVKKKTREIRVCVKFH